MLWLLVRLRYKLIWANMRTSNGKVIAFLCLYVLGALVAAVVAFGGLGAAVIAVKAGRAEMVARLALAGLFASCTSISLFLGMGPTSAMSDSALRAYPLNARARFLFKHLVAALDPIWLFLLVATLGMAVGFQILGVTPIVFGLPLVLIFTFVCYLWAAALLAVIGKLLEFRSGALILMVVVMGSILTVQLSAESKWIHGPIVVAILNRAIDFSPAGACARAMVADEWTTRLAGFVVLLICGFVGATALRIAEVVRLRSGRRKTGPASAYDAYDRVAHRISPRLAPLVAASLRYHLRCNRIRYALISTVPILLLMALTQDRSRNFQGSMLLIILFVTCFLSTAVMAVNFFGWEGNGVARYPLLPVPLVDVLRAHVTASIALGSVPTLIVFGAVLWLSRAALSVELVIFAIANTVAGALFFFTLASWLTVLAPRRVNFDGMMGNVMSRTAQFTLIVAAVGTMFLLRFLAGDVVALARWWWEMALFAVAMYFVYQFSMRTLAPVLARRRERLLDAIVGAPIS